MIKPATLWGLMKSCDNDQWIGRICRALGGQDVDLDYGQQQMVNSIKMDSGWMDERIEAQRERWRERDRRRRDREKREIGENGENSRLTQSHDTSIHPSVHPSIQEELDADAVARTRARGKAPTIEEVLRFAADNTHHPDGKTYPDDWARGWYVYMEQSDPPWTKNGSPIGSWRQKMITDWAIHQKEVRNENKGKGEMPVGMVLHQEGYDASKGGI